MQAIKPGYALLSWSDFRGDRCGYENPRGPGLECGVFGAVWARRLQGSTTEEPLAIDFGHEPLVVQLAVVRQGDSAIRRGGAVETDGAGIGIALDPPTRQQPAP